LIPSTEWQVVPDPDEVALPNGGHYNMDLNGGKNMVRWDYPPPSPDKVIYRTPEFGWSACKNAVTPRHIDELSEWRSYSKEFCQWLVDNGYLGLHNGCWAFPLDDGNGRIVGCHHFNRDEKQWR